MLVINRTHRGFTLLEVMVSLAIISGLLVTLIYTLNYHLGIADKHEFGTIATLLAKNKITELELSPENAKGSFPEPYAAYLFTAEVKKYPFPGIAELSVTVSSGKETVRLSRLVGIGK